MQKSHAAIKTFKPIVISDKPPIISFVYMFSDSDWCELSFEECDTYLEASMTINGSYDRCSNLDRKTLKLIRPAIEFALNHPRVKYRTVTAGLMQHQTVRLAKRLGFVVTEEWEGDNYWEVQKKPSNLIVVDNVINALAKTKAMRPTHFAY